MKTNIGGGLEIDGDGVLLGFTAVHGCEADVERHLM